jgi:hypothetical protein
VVRRRFRAAPVLGRARREPRAASAAPWSTTAPHAPTTSRRATAGVGALLQGLAPGRPVLRARSWCSWSAPAERCSTLRLLGSGCQAGRAAELPTAGRWTVSATGCGAGRGCNRGLPRPAAAGLLNCAAHHRSARAPAARRRWRLLLPLQRGGAGQRLCRQSIAALPPPVRWASLLPPPTRAGFPAAAPAAGRQPATFNRNSRPGLRVPAARRRWEQEHYFVGGAPDGPLNTRLPPMTLQAAQSVVGPQLLAPALGACVELLGALTRNRGGCEASTSPRCGAADRSAHGGSASGRSSPLRARRRWSSLAVVGVPRWNARRPGAAAGGRPVSVHGHPRSQHARPYSPAGAGRAAAAEPRLCYVSHHDHRARGLQLAQGLPQAAAE